MMFSKFRKCFSPFKPPALHDSSSEKDSSNIVFYIQKDNMSTDLPFFFLSFLYQRKFFLEAIVPEVTLIVMVPGSRTYIRRGSAPF